MPTRDPRRNNDDLSDIPAMKPAHDEVVNRRRQARSSSSAVIPTRSSNRLGLLTLLIAIAASAASYYLYEQNREAAELALQTEIRIAALEAQLANTGDEMSQSDAAVRVRLKELDTEVRKLWDNVWKKSKVLLDEHSLNIKNLTTRTGSLGKAQTKAGKQLAELNAELMRYAAGLDEINEAVEQSQANDQKARALQDKLPKLSQKMDDHEQRIQANEEWVESINAFRRQVNKQLTSQSQPANISPALQ
ncbi:MAG: hypothetical protein HOL40_02650 [Cellvibrionales bacterium]|nr:hypothetical protein [Cellvibrionales bacterium]